MLSLNSVSRVLYAMKANFNPEVLRTLAMPVSILTAFPRGRLHLRDALRDDATGRILFTPNFAPREEYEWGIQEGLRVTLDNLFPLKAWPELFAGQRLFVRIDPIRAVVTTNTSLRSGNDPSLVFRCRNWTSWLSWLSGRRNRNWNSCAQRIRNSGACKLARSGWRIAGSG